MTTTRETADPTSLQKMQTSPDHAELVRLAEAAARMWPASGMITWFTRDGGHLDDMDEEDREFIAAMSPAIILVGLLDPHPTERDLHAGLDKTRRVTGYWDSIDDAWCPVGSTWEGPWFIPTHWLPLPSAHNQAKALK